jgi:hypothetical protein
MTFKTGLTAGLLLFVAASILAPIVRSAMHRKDPVPGEITPVRPDGLVVCYFRAKVRCPACRTLEACSREVVDNQFAHEVAAGQIQWQAIDYQSPGNEHFLSDYQLLTGGVVLVEFRDSRPQRWTALPETWNMTADRTGLSKYLEDQIRAFQAMPDKERRP